MTLSTLLISIGIISIILTLLIGRFMNEEKKSWLLTFLQTFTGVLFIFSGIVKAIDPLGTAYKMEQYFAEFEATAEGTWFAFTSGLFPILSTYAIAFSVFMIVLEIALGVMLLIGTRKNFTSWAFFIIVAFFTVLTGFTFLTGYVPSGENFFSFSKWGAFSENNMRVTDCGCFGDFLKLEPMVSFMKDLVLLIPAFIFLFRKRQMHTLFSEKTRNIMVSAVIGFSLVFCFMNFHFNIPVVDFRPFKINEPIREKRQAELDAAGAVEVTGYRLKNAKTGQVVELSMDTYLATMDDYKEEEGWAENLIEQIKDEPTIEATKLSDFNTIKGVAATEQTIFVYQADPETVSELSLQDTIDMQPASLGWTLIDTKTETYTDERDMTDDILNDPNYSFMIVAHDWNKSNLKAFSTKVKTLHENVEGKGLNFYVMTKGGSEEELAKFKADAAINYPLYTADDILLKTIVRSNPGVVLMKDGKIVMKWHHKKLPSFENIEKNYLK